MRRMTGLLDVNMLVSLAWPNHVHHVAARRWFRERRDRWATTPVTEVGFVRVSSNRAAIPTAVAPSQALGILAQMRDAPGHVFLADDVEMVTGHHVAQGPILAGHQQVTDAHLLAVAARHGARLVTFDRGIRSLAGSAGNVELVPIGG